MSKKKSLFAFFGVLLLIVSALLLFAVPKSDYSASARDIPAERFDPSEFSKLTYGIYWYQSGSDMPIAAKDAQNFDPAKPTLIYTHGMKVNHEGLTDREGLSLKGNNEEYMTAAGFSPYLYEGEFYQPLIDQGYNVGIFYWNQLADCYFTEDDKFWVDHPMNGSYYTYVGEDGEFCTSEPTDDDNPECSVTALYRDCLVETLGKDFSGHLQLVGHSMGGQLTLAVSQALCVAYDRGDISSRYLPDRVTVIDPYLGSTPCSGEIDTTGEEVPLKDPKPTALLAAEAAENIANHGIPIEGFAANKIAYAYYDIPFVGVNDKALVAKIEEKFAANIAWVYLSHLVNTYTELSARLPGIHAEMPFLPTHTMAVDYYFSTMYMDVKTDNGGVPVPSFKVSDDDIRRMKGMSFRQDPSSTVDKPNPIYMNDCSYVRINGVTKEEIDATPLRTALSGTITEKEHVINIRLIQDDEVVGETTSIKGKYLFSDVEEGAYTLAFYYNDNKIAEKTDVEVSYSDDLLTVEEIKTDLPEEKKLQLTKDQLIFGIVALAFIVGILIEIAVVSAKKRRR